MTATTVLPITDTTDIPAPSTDFVLASDAERDTVADRVRTAYAEGRLTGEELDQRLTQALRARTRGALLPVTADLPPAGAHRTAPALAPMAPASAARRRGMQVNWPVYAASAAVCLGIWATVALLGGGTYFWPLWVLIPWGPVLAVGTLSTHRHPSRQLTPGQRGTDCHGRTRTSCFGSAAR